jgi:photosystem II stability/assembly factor-like uncharacterized protein
VSGRQGTWLRTTNGGTSWTSGRVPGADSLEFRDVHALDANNAYLLSIGNGPQSRIYRTSDGGATWQLQFTNNDARAFYDCFDFWDARRAIVIGDAIDGDVQLLGTMNGMTWQRLPNTLTAPQGEGSFAASGLCVEAIEGGHGWIVASNPQSARILRTRDYGRTWTATPLPITTHDGSGPQSVSFRDARNGIVLGGGYQAQANDVLAAITTDGGVTWQPRARPPMTSGAWGGVNVPGAPNTVVAVGPNGIAYSRDNAASWTQADTLNYWSVGFASRRAGWAVGARGRITKLTGF